MSKNMKQVLADIKATGKFTGEMEERYPLSSHAELADYQKNVLKQPFSDYESTLRGFMTVGCLPTDCLRAIWDAA